jgi:hypothetical protein
MIAHFGIRALVLSLALFFWEFLFVAKVAIIHRRMQKKWLSSLGRFSQTWLKTKYEIQVFTHPSIFLAKHLKPNTESWKFSPFFHQFWRLKTPKIPQFPGFFNFANKEKCWDSLVSNLPMCCCKKSLFLFSTANVVESCYSPESHYLLTTCVHRS